MSILSTKRIAKHFGGVKAVDNLSIEIKKGKITGIIGPNGSGKTTLTNVLTGMIGLDRGVVVIKGEKLSSICPYEIKSFGITRTFQNVRLFEQMPVLDNILIVLTKRNVWSSLFEKHEKMQLAKAEEILKKIGLWEKRNELAINLSYGQRKLLEVGRAIAVDAEIYFFDEPFAGLFKEMCKIISGILKDLRAANKTIVLIEHNMDLIRELSDEVIVMDEGKLLAQGEPNKILKQKDVIEAYLGE